MTQLVVYRDKSYKQVYRTQESLLQDTVNLIHESGESYTTIAARAGVHNTTIHKWCSGTTYSARIDTLRKVLDVFGYRLTITRYH